MNTGTATQGPRSNLRTIVITLDSNGNPQVSSGDETAVISPKKNEEILWKSAHSFLIDFNGNSPFYEQQFSDKYAQSGLVRRDVVSSNSVFYKYNIIINGKTLDPRVGVDP
ncbi:MAG: hypothetical protein ABSF40_17305 [Candidatus Acidiferrales bacterium]|jgi:hypothetical protein